MAVTVDRRPIETIEADVLVCGGGAAELAAAHTAARRGLRTVLVERYGFCGGGAVAGLSGTICGLYEATKRDAVPGKVVHGFADTFITAMESRNGLTAPLLYGLTLTRVHDPLVWREVADGLLKEASVEIIYHCMVTDVLMEGDRVAGVEAYTKQGRLRVLAGVTIDATGDADVTAMAGLTTFMGADGHVQNPTMIFRIQGVDTDLFRATYGEDTIMPPAISEAIRAADPSGAILPRTKIWLFPTTHPGELLCNCTRVTGGDGRELNPVFRRDFSEAEIRGREQARAYANFFRDAVAGCQASWLEDTGVQVGVRQTRQIGGVERLMNVDVTSGRKRPDGVARSPWPIELHAGERPRVEWLLDDYYEVPFGCFVPASGQSLLAAGRCLSAEHEAVASARVTAQCFSYGHAIGHAAVTAVRDHVQPRDIPGSTIRDLLNRDGAKLD